MSRSTTKSEGIPERSPLDEAAAKLLRAKRRDLLLVEDTAAHAALIRRALESEHWEIEHVTRASTALLSFTRDPNRIVLLDLTLPDGDGLQVLSELIRFDADTPVIVVTALEQVSVSVEAMQRGAWNYVVKGEPRETAERLRDAVETAWVRRLQAAENRLLEESRIRQMVRSERLQAIELIVRTVCHEVNNPLSGVVALSQLLSQSEKLGDQDLRRLADGIARSAQEVARVVQKLRTIGDNETEFGGKQILDIDESRTNSAEPVATKEPG